MRQFTKEQLGKLRQALQTLPADSRAAEVRPSRDFSLSAAQELAALRAGMADHEPERIEE